MKAVLLAFVVGLGLVLASPGPAHGANALTTSTACNGPGFFDIGTHEPIDFGTWSDDGSVAAESSACIASADTPSNSPGPKEDRKSTV